MWYVCLIIFFASVDRWQDDEDDADSKKRRAKAGKGQGADDAENAKRLVDDLVGAFSGFRVSSVALPAERG